MYFDPARECREIPKTLQKNEGPGNDLFLYVIFVRWKIKEVFVITISSKMELYVGWCMIVCMGYHFEIEKVKCF